MVGMAGLPVARRPPLPTADSASRHAVRPAAVAPSARSTRCCLHSSSAMQVPQPAACLYVAQRQSVRQCITMPGQQQQAHVSLGSLGSSISCSRRSISCGQTVRPCRRKQPIVCRAATATLMRGDDDDHDSSRGLTDSSSASDQPSLSEAPSQDGEPTTSAAATEANGTADEPLRSRANTAMIALRCAVRFSCSAHSCAHSTKICKLGAKLLSSVLMSSPAPPRHVRRVGHPAIWNSNDASPVSVTRAIGLSCDNTNRLEQVSPAHAEPAGGGGGFAEAYSSLDGRGWLRVGRLVGGHRGGAPAPRVPIHGRAAPPGAAQDGAELGPNAAWP